MARPTYLRIHLNLTPARQELTETSLGRRTTLFAFAKGVRRAGFRSTMGPPHARGEQAFRYGFKFKRGEGLRQTCEI
jgi:hypothetical protein